MARVKITRTQLNVRAFAAVTLVAADATNKNQADMTGYETLLAFNSDASSHTVTINSAPDPTGRTKDITAQSIAAGKIYVYGPFKFLQGWAQGGSSLNFEADDATVKFAWLCPPFV